MGTETQWWWIRHAPVPDGGRIYGQRDLDCDCTDANMFAALAKTLPRDAVWLTSQLKRTRQTAAAIMAAMGGADRREPIPVPELAEQDLGDWQGLARAEFFASRTPARHNFWFAPARERAPGGESFCDVVARVGATVERLTAQFRGRAIIAVAHGGTIRAALALALRLDPEAALAFVVEHCSITRIDHLGGDAAFCWRIGTVNRRPGGAAAALTPAPSPP